MASWQTFFRRKCSTPERMPSRTGCTDGSCRRDALWPHDGSPSPEISLLRHWGSRQI